MVVVFTFLSGKMVLNYGALFIHSMVNERKLLLALIQTQLLKMPGEKLRKLANKLLLELILLN
jgi:hypothetical protein